MANKAWGNYEEVAKYLLDKNAKEFGFEKVEGKQSVSGQRSGTNWVIDAKGIKDDGKGFVIIECRRYTGAIQKSNTSQAANGKLSIVLLLNILRTNPNPF